MSNLDFQVKNHKKRIWVIVVSAIVLICIAAIVVMQFLRSQEDVPDANDPLTTLNDFLEQNECIEYTYDNGSYKRIYKTFHNIVTSDYYDVFYDENGNIKMLIKSEDTITEDEIPEDSWTLFSQEIDPNLQFSVAEDEQIVQKSISDMYVKINDEVIPTRIIYCTYQNEKGYQYLKTFCYNLLDGSSIDYYTELISSNVEILKGWK